MKRVRVSTLMLLIVITALLLTVVLQQRRIARLEGDKESLDDVITELRMDKAQGWLVREGQGKAPRSGRQPSPKAAGQ
jgi:cytochrome c-type biogenesis protein CcmH/NrfG